MALGHCQHITANSDEAGQLLRPAMGSSRIVLPLIHCVFAANCDKSVNEPLKASLTPRDVPKETNVIEIVDSVKATIISELFTSCFVLWIL